MENIKNILKRRVVVFDGATGTELQKRGMPSGVCPEIWCLENPGVLKSVHKEYKKAGADVVTSCTFGANRIKLKQHGSNNVRGINKKLALLAREAVGRGTLVAGDIGPTGEFVRPFGTLDFEEAVNVFKEQARGLAEGGVDFFVIETMMDIQEARAALIAVKETAGLFAAVTMTYEGEGRTLNGTDPRTALITLQSLGADAVGCNCSTGPENMISFVKEMKPWAKVPLLVQPNAGIPEFIGGKTKFGMKPREFASFGKELVESGANAVGGCCGTGPSYIKQLRGRVLGAKPVLPQVKAVSALSSARGSIVLQRNNPLVIVGECINPTGKKNLQEELKEGKVSLVRALAKDQVKKGADILDVNVGAAGVDEKTMLKKVSGLLSVITDLPLSLDSSDTKAIESALREYPGRALVNSVSGEKKNLKKALAVSAKYGAMIVILPLDERGVAEKFERRREIINKVFKQAQKMGVSKEDIVVDSLILPVSASPDSANEALKTIDWCTRVFKCNSIAGLSNISFGMPGRDWINAAYIAMAQAKGLTLAIANPFSQEVINIKKSADVLLKKEQSALLLCSHFGKKVAEEGFLSKKSSAKQKVYNSIIEGNKDDIKIFIREALKKGMNPYNLTQEVMIPAINKVGILFDKKEYFLPQLIASAETMKEGFDILSSHFGKFKQGSPKEKKAVVIVATVEGDIHDIGKNIVTLMLKNYGFHVVDLGKNVSSQKIVWEIKRHKSPVVGLSALMTTTMVNMKKVIDKAEKEGVACSFVVGGAVVTKKYARSIGAEYARDGVEAVRVVKRLVSRMSAGKTDRRIQKIKSR